MCVCVCWGGDIVEEFKVMQFVMKCRVLMIRGRIDCGEKECEQCECTCACFCHVYLLVLFLTRKI